MWSPMKELFILMAHVLTTLVKLVHPGGVRSVVAQSLALRHQLCWCCSDGDSAHPD